MRFAMHLGVLSQPQADGQPLGVHLQEAYKRAGHLHPLLEAAPSLPHCCEHLPEWWREQVRRSGFGPEPLNHAGIFTWAVLTGRRPHPWEVKALIDMDKAFLAGQSMTLDEYDRHIKESQDL